MSQVYLPSLSADGWIPESQKMVDGLIAHMYCSDYSQTNLFRDAVMSVAKIIKTNQSRIEEASIDFQKRLVNYLSAYFKRVDISIRPVATDDSVLQGELMVIGEVEDTSGNIYTLFAALTNKGSIGKKVQDYLDSGVLQ